MSASENEVIAANQAFYEAFAGGDFPRMVALWAREQPVTCIHPGWDVLVGRQEVLASWRAILAPPGNPIEASRPQAFMLGDVATVICHEGARGMAPSLVATNVFAREAGQWKMVHHQAGPLARHVEPTVTRPTN